MILASPKISINEVEKNTGNWFFYPKWKNWHIGFQPFIFFEA
jgi:hypothetical protein